MTELIKRFYSENGLRERYLALVPGCSLRTEIIVPVIEELPRNAESGLCRFYWTKLLSRSPKGSLEGAGEAESQVPFRGEPN